MVKDVASVFENAGRALVPDIEDEIAGLDREAEFRP